MIDREEVDKAISILNGLNHVAEASILTGLLYVGDQVAALRDDLEQREITVEQRHRDMLGQTTNVEYIGSPSAAKGGTFTIRHGGGVSDAIPYDAHEEQVQAAFDQAYERNQEIPIAGETIEGETRIDPDDGNAYVKLDESLNQIQASDIFGGHNRIINRERWESWQLADTGESQ